MDIHKPKPWHGVREFLKEYVIIVVGVLTALGAEQAVEWLHWRHEISAGREHLREEIRFDERVYAHRVDVASCVQKNLTALKVVIAGLRSDKQAALVPEFISPENGPVRHEIWNSLSAAQVLVHFPKDELQRYGQFYQAREDDEYFMDRESRAWRQLHLLEGDPNRLSKQEIGALWVTAGEAEEMSQGVALVSQAQVDTGRALGIEIPKPDLSKRGECKAILGTP
jgi:hypothetical protein